MGIGEKILRTGYQQFHGLVDFPSCRFQIGQQFQPRELGKSTFSGQTNNLEQITEFFESRLSIILKSIRSDLYPKLINCLPADQSQGTAIGLGPPLSEGSTRPE